MSSGRRRTRAWTAAAAQVVTGRGGRGARGRARATTGARRGRRQGRARATAEARARAEAVARRVGGARRAVVAGQCVSEREEGELDIG
jgi:hypothetical protein